VIFGADFDRHHDYALSLHLACGLFLGPALLLLTLGRYRVFGPDEVYAGAPLGVVR
jgi:hypothetical protein